MPGHTVRQPVLRNPLDAMVARFFAAEDRDLSQVRVVRDVKALAGLPTCPFALAGAACWDADYYTQSLSDHALCEAAGASEEAPACPALAVHKKLLASFFASNCFEKEEERKVHVHGAVQGHQQGIQGAGVRAQTPLE